MPDYDLQQSLRNLLRHDLEGIDLIQLYEAIKNKFYRKLVKPDSELKLGDGLHAPRDSPLWDEAWNSLVHHQMKNYYLRANEDPVSMINIGSGEAWQYMGTYLLKNLPVGAQEYTGWFHSFRHKDHPHLSSPASIHVYSTSLNPISLQLRKKLEEDNNEIEILS